jgi:FlaA1/EpsC-like NDP-sugar epimerase
VSDLVLTQLALQIGRYLRFWFPLLGAYPYPAPSPLRPVVYWVVPIIWAIVFSLLGLYSIRHLRQIRRELGRLMAGVLLSGLVFAGSLYALYLYEIYVPRLLLAYFLAIDFLLLAAMRIGLRDLLSRNGLFYRPRALIVGTNETARRLADAIGRDIHAELDLIGTIPWNEVETHVGAKSPMEHLIERTKALQIDEVILASRPESRLLVEEVAGALKANGVGVRIVLDGPGEGASEFEIEALYGVIALRLRAVPESTLERWVQRWLGWR